MADQLWMVAVTQWAVDAALTNKRAVGEYVSVRVEGLAVVCLLPAEHRARLLGVVGLDRVERVEVHELLVGDEGRPRDGAH